MSFVYTELGKRYLVRRRLAKEGIIDRTHITKMPGTKPMRIVRFCYSAKTVEFIFDPIYADFCEEYFAALAAGEKWRARWIRVRYYKDFARATGWFGVGKLVKTVFEYLGKIA